MPLLHVQDASFQAQKTIESAPRGLTIREVVMNGLEAKVHPSEWKRVIRLSDVEFEDYPVRKLEVLNSGVGMSIDELKQYIAGVSGTSNKPTTVSRKNHGDGVTSRLKYQSEGIVVVSRKDDLISKIKIYLTDDGYGYDEPVAITWSDLTTEQKLRYSVIPATCDFTAVTLLGAYPEQQTFHDVDGDKTDAFESLDKRFFDFRFEHLETSHMALDMAVVYSDGHKRVYETASNKLKTLAATSKIQLATVPVIDNPDINIWYYVSDDQNLVGKLQLLFKNELYLVSNWGPYATNFGMNGMTDKVSVIVEIKSSMPGVDDDYFRERILQNGDPIKIEKFASAVKNSAPDFVIALRPKKREENDFSAVKEQLRQLCNELVTGGKKVDNLIKLKMSTTVNTDSKTQNIRVVTTQEGVNIDHPGVVLGGINLDVELRTRERLVLITDQREKNGVYVWNGPSVAMTRWDKLASWTKYSKMVSDGLVFYVRAGTFARSEWKIVDFDPNGLIGVTDLKLVKIEVGITDTPLKMPESQIKNRGNSKTAPMKLPEFSWEDSSEIALYVEDEYKIVLANKHAFIDEIVEYCKKHKSEILSTSGAQSYLRMFIKERIMLAIGSHVIRVIAGINEDKREKYLSPEVFESLVKSIQVKQLRADAVWSVKQYMRDDDLEVAAV